MKHHFLVTILIFFTLVNYAQINITGVVKDNQGNLLEMANVMAYNIEDNVLEDYSITNEKGEFNIEISKQSTLQIKVSYLGFQSQTKVLVIKGDTVKNFTLKESINSLDTVEITYEMPVTIKGDTLIYNADSFTTGKERKLGDVLKKLPGVEVNAQGEIQVEGKKVSKVMVEGKDFFDGDAKLATKNIPADAIKKVEVLKNYNDVSQMRGLGDDSDRIAINIRLKEGKKSFWFGEVTAGLGEGDKKTRYLAHPKLFFYSPKKSINLITDFDNMGEIPFTFQDYFKFSGGFKNSIKGGGLNLSSDDLGFSFLKENKAKEVSNKFAAFNWSQVITNYLSFSGFAIFSGAKNELQTTNSSTLTYANFTENTQSQTRQNNNLGLLKISLGYKPNINLQLDYDLLTKFSGLSDNNITHTYSISEDDLISGLKNKKPFSFNQNINAYFTLDDKNIFSFFGKYLYKKKNPNYRLESTNKYFSDLPVDDSVSKYRLTQEKETKTHQLQAALDYYYILNNKSNLNITLGSVYNSQVFNSNIFQTLDNNSIFLFKDTYFNNQVNYKFSDLFFGLHYKLQTGIFTLTPGLSAHQYKTKNQQLRKETIKSPFYILPEFTVKIALKSLENIWFKYNISTEFTDISNLSEGVLLNSYNNLSFGNKSLKNVLFHKYRMLYSNFNSFNYAQINGSLQYMKKYQAIAPLLINPTTFSSKNSFINSDKPEENFFAHLSFSKRIGKFKANISGELILTKSRQFTQLLTGEVISKNTQFINQKYKTSVLTSFNNWPNFEVGYKTTVDKFERIQSVNHKPFGNLEVSLLKNFILTADYTFNKFTDSQKNTNTYDFLNLDLYYQKEGSKWEFKASGINLLDTKSINNDYFSNNYISNSQYKVQPRYLLFSVKYDL